jgi:hypothetical protein
VVGWLYFHSTDGTRWERGAWTPVEHGQYSGCELRDETDLAHVGRDEVAPGLQYKRPRRATPHVGDAHTSEARYRAPGA